MVVRFSVLTGKPVLLIGGTNMPELSTVEYDYSIKHYVAILTNGEKIVLEASGLRAAEEEAERYLMHNEFTSFSAPVTWK